MADYIEVDTAALDRDRQTIQSELDRVRSEIGRLRDEMASLSSMWEGPAHDTFMAQFNADYEFVQQFGNEIGTYIETMEYAQSEYQKCEASVEQAVASIRV